jgi:hypothetical protein
MIVQCSQSYRIINDANRTRLIIPGCNKPYSTCVGFGNKLRGLHINAWTNQDNQKDLEYMMLTYSGKPLSTTLCSRIKDMVESEFEFDSCEIDDDEDNDVYFSHYRDLETRVWVKIKDYPNLLSDLSMIFVSLGINVLSASITTQNGNALDTFRVEKDGKRISDELEDEIKLLIKLLEVQGHT